LKANAGFAAEFMAILSTPGVVAVSHVLSTCQSNYKVVLKSSENGSVPPACAVHDLSQDGIKDGFLNPCGSYMNPELKASEIASMICNNTSVILFNLCLAIW
jgi:hypothetical protein